MTFTSPTYNARYFRNAVTLEQLDHPQTQKTEFLDRWFVKTAPSAATVRVSRDATNIKGLGLTDGIITHELLRALSNGVRKQLNAETA